MQSTKKIELSAENPPVDEVVQVDGDAAFSEDVGDLLVRFFGTAETHLLAQMGFRVTPEMLSIPRLLAMMGKDQDDPA